MEMTLVSTRYTSHIRSHIRITEWRGVAIRQVFHTGRRGHEKAPERGHARQALPFLEAHDHGLRPSMPGDDRGFAVHRLIDDGGEVGLGVTELNFFHGADPVVTTIVI